MVPVFAAVEGLAVGVPSPTITLVFIPVPDMGIIYSQINLTVTRLSLLIYIKKTSHSYFSIP